ncbi:MAG: M6 family metalloprotease domain-containing protein [Bacteroidaceae bacterium]|nr:M6 family metalloprotease domain-containing protein [Bacteroidaceae bacterium]
MKKFFVLVMATFLATLAMDAQQRELRMGCVQQAVTTRGEEMYSLPAPYVFDAERTYRVPVILVAYESLGFSMDDAARYYDRLFNERGFNEGVGRGCVSDYFREQSRGRANLEFDIYGPMVVDEPPKKSIGTNYGFMAQRKALTALRATEERDFSIYDWEGDGEVNLVLFVFAGFTGNEMTGYVWPNSGAFSGLMPGGIYASFSSTSCERIDDENLCGIGTIVHEFCHYLGLPDIYPLPPATSYSTVDEWDVMDGGNYTNYGWCPPNLTAMELMYLGWDMPVELDEPVRVEAMKSLSEGGKTYMIRSGYYRNEFYLLENRQQEGWDYGIPGKGLVIYHVDFDEVAWRNNKVNVSDSHYRYDLFHADGLNYRAWDGKNNGKDNTRWTMEHRLRSSYLSTAAYPYTDALTHEVNARLTDDSKPAATLYNSTDQGRQFMGKPITNICMSTDGTVSFNFMTDETGIEAIDYLAIDNLRFDVQAWFSLDGRRLSGKPAQRGVYVNGRRKVLVK